MWWPDAIFEAEHHAVWRTPEGNLIDVTQRMPNVASKRPSVFVSDNTIAIDLNYAPYMHNRFGLQHDTPVGHEVINAWCAKHEIQRKQATLQYRLGGNARVCREIAAGRVAPGTRLALAIPSGSAQAAAFKFLTAQLETANLRLGNAYRNLRKEMQIWRETAPSDYPWSPFPPD